MSEMKLWLLRPVDNLKVGDDPWDPWYDKAFGFVVRAKTEIEAREIADIEGRAENREFDSPWLDAMYSSCLELLSKGEAGLIIRDFASA